MNKRSIDDFRRLKAKGEAFACLTAYDAPTARILERAGIPLILVGDSVANVVLGYDSTVPVTMEEMLHHTRAVRRGAADTFVVADMPFLSYQVSEEEAIRNAGRFLKEGGADAVKLEGGAAILPLVRRLTELGISVMGHVGLTPQTATSLGGMKVQGTDARRAAEIVDESQKLVDAGVFAVVLECVPSEVAAVVSESIAVPTVGIGAGSACDAQILVLHDLLGFQGGYQPRFVRRYAELEETIFDAVSRYQSDVTDKKYPDSSESFGMGERELERFEGLTGRSSPREKDRT